MECTVVIDERLLEQAQAALGTTSVQETVEAGLKAAIQRKREADFLAAVDRINFDMTDEELQRLRRADIKRLELSKPGEAEGTAGTGAGT